MREYSVLVSNNANWYNMYLFALLKHIYLYIYYTAQGTDYKKNERLTST